MGLPAFQRLNAEQQAQTLRTFLAAPPSSPTSTRYAGDTLKGLFPWQAQRVISAVSAAKTSNVVSVGVISRIE